VSLLVLAIALVAPGLGWAAETEAPSVPETDETKAPQPDPGLNPLPPVDDQGRPFPDPSLVRMGRNWIGTGAALTVTGAGLVLGGMVVGSALARGEIVDTPVLRGVLVGALAGGAALAGVGLPTLSAGTFTTRQLLRTIRGAEKVPRTVANERSYWLAYRSSQYGQSLAIAGGASIMLGVVAVAAVAATIDTDYYDPLYWLIPVGMFGGGAAMTVGGLLWKRDSDLRLESIQDAVDPYRNGASSPASSETRRSPRAEPLLPRLSLMVHPRKDGSLGGSLRLGWGFAF